MVKLASVDLIKLEDDKMNKKSIPVKSVSVDFYDTDVMEKAIKKINKEEKLSHLKWAIVAMFLESVFENEFLRTVFF